MFLCHQLTESFGGNILLFHSGRACAHIKAVGKFFFWRRFFTVLTGIEENNFHVVMGWPRENFMYSKIHPSISDGAEGLVRAAFIILQKKLKQILANYMEK